MERPGERRRPVPRARSAQDPHRNASRARTATAYQPPSSSTRLERNVLRGYYDTICGCYELASLRDVEKAARRIRKKYDIADYLEGIHCDLFVTRLSV